MGALNNIIEAIGNTPLVRLNKITENVKQFTLGVD